MVAPKREIDNEEDIVRTLEEVVARIQARGEGFVLPRPPQEAIDRLVARVADEPPMSPEEERAWNRQWDEIMDEMHRRDRENDIAEGRGGGVVTVNSEGQITLPEEVRQALGVLLGSHIEFEIRPDEVVLRRCIPDEVFDAWRGYLVGKTPWTSTDEMMADLRGEQ